MVTSSPQMLSVPLSSTYLMQETVKDCNINFANFVGMKVHNKYLYFKF